MASSIDTLSVRDMVEALIAGKRDPQVLAGLARGRMKANHAALVEALTGRFDDHHGELASILLAQIDGLTAQIDMLTARIGELIPAIPAARGVDPDGTTGPQAGRGPDAPVLPAVARLAEIPGISVNAAQVIIAEVGLDMSRFPTAGHLVSWARLSPRTIQSGSRTRPGRTAKGNPYLKGVLGDAADAAGKTSTFLGERYRRLVKRRGKLKALVATAPTILVIIWHLLADLGGARSGRGVIPGGGVQFYAGRTPGGAVQPPGDGTRPGSVSSRILWTRTPRMGAGRRCFRHGRCVTRPYGSPALTNPARPRAGSQCGGFPVPVWLQRPSVARALTGRREAPPGLTCSFFGRLLVRVADTRTMLVRSYVGSC